MNRFIAALIFATISLAGLAAEPVLINVDEANPPFMYIRNGKAEGIYPALIRAAFKQMSVPVDVQAKPWKRTLQEIDSGIAGVGGIYKNSERLKKYDYSEPLFLEKLVIYFNASHPINYARIDDLKDKHVGVLRGWSYGDEFDQARKAHVFVAEEVSSDDQNFRKLESARIDAAIAIQESGVALMSSHKGLGSAETPLSQNPTFLAFSKGANQTELLKRFDQTIREMRKTGEFQKLVSAELAK